MFFEAAEGGIGVCEQLVDQVDGLARVATRALELCHFSPDGDDLGGVTCSAACYECLLAYENQAMHRHLDRRLLRDVLVSLASSTTERTSGGEGRDAQYERLLLEIDPGAPLEREFLDFLSDNGYRLPDRAQFRPEEEVFTQPDFFFERSRACIFVDHPAHHAGAAQERDEATRQALAERGHRVIEIGPPPFAVQVREYQDVFGEPGRS